MVDVVELVIMLILLLLLRSIEIIVKRRFQFRKNVHNILIIN